MWVKICGNTTLEDAALAAELGADAVGFVFAESPRRVTAALVAAITAHLPQGVERVGVFHSRDADQIVKTVAEAGLTGAQLHGGMDEGLLEGLAEHFAGTVRIIQTLHWRIGAPESPASLLTTQLQRLAALGIVDRVLIDSKVGSAGGGTGVAYDWSAASNVFASALGGLRLIVAGGLKTDNVGTAITQLTPWGVDVASGVEASPGRKDPEKLAQFIRNARGTQKP